MRARLATAAGYYIGLVFLASGAALVANILFGVPLLPALAIGLLGGIAAIATFAYRAPRPARDRVVLLARTGLLAGIVGIIAYDSSKAVLSIADPSPYNPFEAVRIFGVLLIGDGAPAIVTWVCGAAFHLLNGVLFAIAYTQFFGAFAVRSARLAVLTGMAWGIFLETFQLILFPGWLSIQFVAEFATISLAAHFVYGATVGTIVRRRLLATGVLEPLPARPTMAR